MEYVVSIQADPDVPFVTNPARGRAARSDYAEASQLHDTVAGPAVLTITTCVCLVSVTGVSAGALIVDVVCNIQPSQSKSSGLLPNTKTRAAMGLNQRQMYNKTYRVNVGSCDIGACYLQFGKSFGIRHKCYDTDLVGYSESRNNSS